MKAKRIPIFMLICVMLFTSFSFAKGEVTKTKIIYTSDKDYKYEGANEYAKNGKNYRIKDIKYEVIKNPDELKEEVEIKNLKTKKAPETKVFNINGEKVKLFLDKGKTTYTLNPKEETYVYEARDPYAFKPDEEREFKGRDDKEVKGKLKEVIKGNIYKAGVNISGNFRGDANSEHFYFEGTGNLWPLNTTAPIWQGYEEDILTYLGLNPRSYGITGGIWTGKSISNGVITRTASFRGTKDVCDYSCIYQINDGEETYRANAIYSGYMIKITIVYEEYMSLAKKIFIGAGIGIFAIAFSAILVWIVKRKEKEEDM